ncbi:MAG: hypothetical protein AVDCRST_MAG05-2013, partial [uncultured Rubrobacteraceae bacterium]
GFDLGGDRDVVRLRLPGRLCVLEVRGGFGCGGRDVRGLPGRVGRALVRVRLHRVSADVLRLDLLL